MIETPRHTQIGTLLLAYREALHTTNGDHRTKGSSAALQMSELWHAGERAFTELERCLDHLAKVAPVQLEHLRACYGLPPFDLPRSRVKVRRRGEKWLNLGPHCRIVASPLPDAWNRTGKPVTVEIEVIVERWPAWVRAEKVRRAISVVADAYMAGGEVYVPVEFVPVAA